jgi:hypothetical protein
VIEREKERRENEEQGEIGFHSDLIGQADHARFRLQIPGVRDIEKERDGER